MPKTPKFNYLLASLTGKSASLVQGLQFSEENYDHAGERLREALGKEQSLRRVNMKELTSLEAVKSYKHLKGVKRLYNKVQFNKPELESLGVELESYVPMLLTLIKKALPADMIVDFNMKEATTETKNVTGSSLSVSDASVETIQGL